MKPLNSREQSQEFEYRNAKKGANQFNQKHKLISEKEFTNKGNKVSNVNSSATSKSKFISTNKPKDIKADPIFD